MYLPRWEENTGNFSTPVKLHIWKMCGHYSSADCGSGALVFSLRLSVQRLSGYGRIPGRTEKKFFPLPFPLPFVWEPEYFLLWFLFSLESYPRIFPNILLFFTIFSSIMTCGFWIQEQICSLTLSRSRFLWIPPFELPLYLRSWFLYS